MPTRLEYPEHVVYYGFIWDAFALSHRTTINASRLRLGSGYVLKKPVYFYCTPVSQNYKIIACDTDPTQSFSKQISDTRWLELIYIFIQKE